MLASEMSRGMALPGRNSKARLEGFDQVEMPAGEDHGLVVNQAIENGR